VQYAGGGGAGYYYGFSFYGGLGGGGGAGDGGYQPNIPGINAKPNTGSGGGGPAVDYSSNMASNEPGGNGGSGIVVIRYPQFYAPAKTVTGNPSIYTSGGYQIYVWYISGTIVF